MNRREQRYFDVYCRSEKQNRQSPMQKTRYGPDDDLPVSDDQFSYESEESEEHDVVDSWLNEAFRESHKVSPWKPNLGSDALQPGVFRPPPPPRPPGMAVAAKIITSNFKPSAQSISDDPPPIKASAPLPPIKASAPLPPIKASAPHGSESTRMETNEKKLEEQDEWDAGVHRGEAYMKQKHRSNLNPIAEGKDCSANEKRSVYQDKDKVNAQLSLGKKLERLQREIEVNSDILQRLTNNIKELEGVLGRLVRERDGVIKECEENYNRVEKLRKEHVDLDAEIVKMKNTRSILNDELQGMRRRIGEENKILERVKKGVEEENKVLKETKKVRGEVAAEMEAMKEKKNDAERRLKEVREVIGKGEEVMERLKREEEGVMRGIEERRCCLENELREMRNAVEREKSVFDKLEKEKDVLMADIDATRESATKRMQCKFDEMKIAFASEMRREKECQREIIDRLRKEKKELEEEVAKRRKVKTSLENDLEEMREEVEGERRVFQKLTEERGELVEEIVASKDAQNKLNEVKRDLENKMNELRRDEEKLSEICEELRKEKDELMDETENRKREKSCFEDKLKETRKGLLREMNGLKVMRNEKEILHGEIVWKEMRKEIQDEKETIDRLRRERKELEDGNETFIKNKLGDVKKAVEAEVMVLEKMNEEKDKLIREMEAAKRAKIEVENEVEELSKYVEVEKKFIEQLVREKEDLNVAVTVGKKEVDEATKMCQRLMSERDQLKVCNRKLEGSRSTLENEIEAAEEKLKKIMKTKKKYENETSGISPRSKEARGISDASEITKNSDSNKFGKDSKGCKASQRLDSVSDGILKDSDRGGERSIPFEDEDDASSSSEKSPANRIEGEKGSEKGELKKEAVVCSSVLVCCSSDDELLHCNGEKFVAKSENKLVIRRFACSKTSKDDATINTRARAEKDVEDDSWSQLSDSLFSEVESIALCFISLAKEELEMLRGGNDRKGERRCSVGDKIPQHFASIHKHLAEMGLFVAYLNEKEHVKVSSKNAVEKKLQQVLEAINFAFLVQKALRQGRGFSQELENIKRILQRKIFSLSTLHNESVKGHTKTALYGDQRSSSSDVTKEEDILEKVDRRKGGAVTPAKVKGVGSRGDEKLREAAMTVGQQIKTNERLTAELRRRQQCTLKKLKRVVDGGLEMESWGVEEERAKSLLDEEMKMIKMKMKMMSREMAKQKVKRCELIGKLKLEIDDVIMEKTKEVRYLSRVIDELLRSGAEQEERLLRSCEDDRLCVKSSSLSGRRMREDDVKRIKKKISETFEEEWRIRKIYEKGLRELEEFYRRKKEVSDDLSNLEETEYETRKESWRWKKKSDKDCYHPGDRCSRDLDSATDDSESNDRSDEKFPECQVADLLQRMGWAVMILKGKGILQEEECHPHH